MSTVSVRTAIVDTIRTALGAGVKHVAAHSGRFSSSELGRVSAKAPAVFIAALAQSNINSRNGSDTATVSWAAFVVTRDFPNLPRDVSALAVVDALKHIIPENRWGLTDEAEGTPKNIQAQNLFSADIDTKGVAMWALSWQQDIADTSALDVNALANFLRMDTTTDVDPAQAQEPALIQTIELPTA